MRRSIYRICSQQHSCAWMSERRKNIIVFRCDAKYRMIHLTYTNYIPNDVKKGRLRWIIIHFFFCRKKSDENSGLVTLKQQNTDLWKKKIAEINGNLQSESYKWWFYFFALMVSNKIKTMRRNINVKFDGDQSFWLIRKTASLSGAIPDGELMSRTHIKIVEVKQ